MPLGPGNASAIVPVSMMGADGASALSDANPMPVSMMGTGTVMQQPAGCNVTPITTNGTTTIASGGGRYHGLAAVGLGTLWGAAVYDKNGTNTKTLVANLSIGALGILGLAAPQGIGARFNGDLVVVTAGTLPGQINVAWD